MFVFVFVSVGWTLKTSLFAVAALSGIAGLVLEAIVLWVTSDAVTVCEGAVFSVILKDLVPPTSAAFAGRTAFESLDVT